MDEVLFYEWDPIGVSPEPCARGEYENYVSAILELVVRNNEIGPISEQLASIITTSIGLKADRALCDATATLLLEHKKAVHAGLA